MADIESMFPPDPDMSDEKIEQELDRVNVIARILAGGAVATTASLAVHKIWRHYHPFAGIDNE